MGAYILHRDKGLLRKKFSVHRLDNGIHLPLEIEDLNQDLLNYLAFEIRRGRLNKRSGIRANTIDEITEHYVWRFLDSLCACFNLHYSGIRNGYIRLGLDRGIVKAYSEFGEVPTR